MLTVSVGADDGVFIGESHTGCEECRVIKTLVTSVFFWPKGQICKQLLEKFRIADISFDRMGRICMKERTKMKNASYFGGFKGIEETDGPSVSSVLTDAASAEDLACSMRLSSAPKLGLNKKFVSKVADTPPQMSATTDK